MWTVRKAAAIRQREQADRDLILAWHVEYVRVRTANEKRMPDLRKLLQRHATGKQSVENQHVVLEMLADQYGIPLRKRQPKP